MLQIAENDKIKQKTGEEYGKMCEKKECQRNIYHVMMRAINRQDIFFDDEDYRRFLETMKRVKESRSCAIYAYCLMGNHVQMEQLLGIL